MIIGIDLGTTNSLAAYYTEHGPEIIPNRLGERLTPSVVSIDENDQVYVGKTARERMAVYPGQTADLFKRSMGSRKEFKLGNKTFTATELSAMVLRSLKEDAEVYLGEEVTEAVISVPAYFNEVKRKAVKQAGELAGLKVERIISEPTAAAIAYGLYQKNDNTRFLVFDLGGGTFDVSILELFDDILEVRAVAGDNYLGGEDFTNLIVEEFYKEHGINEESLSAKEKAYYRNQAEKCKSKTDYSEWEKHGFENPHFFDLMYIPRCDMYARLHIGPIDFKEDENPEIIAHKRDLYLCLFDNKFNKIKEAKLPSNTFSPYTGWSQTDSGILLFVDKITDQDNSEDLELNIFHPIFINL